MMMMMMMIIMMMKVTFFNECVHKLKYHAGALDIYK